jgi:putative membrane protein
MMGSGGYGMGWMMIPGLLTLLVVVGVGLWLVISLTRQSAVAQPPWSAESPRQILDRRLAAGEIDNEQYAQMVHLIGNRATQPPPV